MTEKIMSLLHRYRETILYLVFGGLTTVVNYAVYFILATALPDWSTLLPNGVAWVVAVLFAYLTNRRWVFRSEARGAGPVLREFSAFVGARVFSGMLDMAIMYVAVDLLHYSDLLIKLLSNILVIVLNYFLSKFWIFRKAK